MNNFYTALASVAALIALAGTTGGIWAVFRASGQDKTIERQGRELTELYQRLAYLEPRTEALQRQNELLNELHNPSKQIEGLSKEQRENHERTYAVVEESRRLLGEMHSRFYPIDGGSSGREGS